MARPANTEVTEQILNAAMALFSQYGFRKTTVDDIARRAEISKGAIYLHFQSKDQIQIALLVRNADRLISRLTDECAEIENPLEKIRHMLTRKAEVIYEFYHSQPHMLEVMPVLLMKFNEKQCDAHVIRPFSEMLNEFLNLAKNQGRIHFDSAEKLTRHLIAMSFAFVPPYRFLQSREELLHHCNTHLDFMFQALEKPTEKVYT